MNHSPRKALREKILEYSKELRLPMIRKHLDEQIQEATQRDASYEEFLSQLLEKECDARREASRYNRIRLAEFTHKKYLEDLVVGDLPEDTEEVETAENAGFCPGRAQRHSVRKPRDRQLSKVFGYGKKSAYIPIASMNVH